MKNFIFKNLLSCLLSLVGITLSAADFNVGGIYYNKLTTNTVEITSSDNNSKYSGDVIIPSKVTFDGVSYEVTKIGDKAFYECGDLTSVIVPNSVTEIGDEAFYGCVKLTTAPITSHITSIGSSAFSSCGIKSINIPEGVTRINYRTFYGCRISSVIIPESVTSIEEEAFCASDLTSVEIPEHVTEIKKGVFSSCRELTDVTLSENVKSIGEEAFKNCTQLKTIKIPNNVTTIGKSAFYGCYSLSEAVIGNGVTNIEYLAFANSGLTSITIPSNVTSIEQYAFNDCYYLESVTINSNAVVSTDYALDRWGTLEYNLRTIFDKYVKKYIIGKNVTRIGNRAFEFCEMTSVIIGDNVRSIGEYAFYKCGNLTSVIIPDNVTSIGYSAFWNCDNLKELTIGEKLESIGQSAFPTYNSLITSVTINNASLISENQNSPKYLSELFGSNVTKYTIGDGITRIGDNVFAENEKLQTVIIPNSIASIGNYAFGGCTSIASIIIPNNVTEIASSAFKGCSKLEEITLPDNLKTIEWATFMGCSNLFSVTLPECMETIDEYAFYGCTNLTEIYLHSTTPPAAEANCFWINATGDNLYEQATLYVPMGCKDVYSAHPVWGQFYNVISAEPPVYQLIYMVDGEVYKIYEVECGSDIMPEPEPTKEGYTFSGWSEIPNTMPAYNVTVTGVFTIVDGIKNIESNGEGVKIYTFDGKRVNTLYKRVNIIRQSDGTCKKVLVK